MVFPDVPPLDAHAHIATDVTMDQVRRLGGAVILAVTRDLSEAATVPFGCYPTLIWGVGVHPRNGSGLAAYSGERFNALLPRFALVGEVGLDHRAGQLATQRQVFSDILARTGDNPVITSIHSTGVAGEVVSLLAQHKVRAPVLHWFGGSVEEIRQAAEIGAWFSVNAAMEHKRIVAMPVERVLTETDFPYTRRVGSHRPGATEPVEQRLAEAWGCPAGLVRRRIWDNFKCLVTASGAKARLPRPVQARVSLLVPASRDAASPQDSY